LFGFNPCFSGTTTYTKEFNSFLISGLIVSILVFLEPPLILKSRIFSGSFFILFQSLFFWNHHLYTEKQLRDALELAKFQSLFFWNHHLYSVKSLLPDNEDCFNPCFSGTTTYTYNWLD